MEEKDFLEIIKPLGLLETSQRDFLSQALLNNFKNWQSKQRNQ